MKVNEHLSVLFLLEKSKTDSQGLTPITIRLTIDGARSEMSLGQKINPSYWNQSHENVCLDTHPNKKEAALLYSTIVQALADLKTHYFFLSQKYDYVSAELLKQSYKGLLVIEEKKRNQPNCRKKQSCKSVTTSTASLQHSQRPAIVPEIL